MLRHKSAISHARARTLPHTLEDKIIVTWKAGRFNKYVNNQKKKKKKKGLFS